jgi:hypothetical protein
VRDATGNYDAMLLAAMAMFAVGGTLLLLLGRYPDLSATTSNPTVRAVPEAA